MRYVSICFSLIGFLVAASPRLAASLGADAKPWYAQHAATFEQAVELSVSGDTVGANQLLMQLADEDGGPVAAYMVGNTLFGSDPAASYRLHERAKQALPNDPAVALEMAMEQHREREYAGAIANYRLFLAAGGNAHYAALLADCLIRTGDFKAAVQAWNQAGHDQHQTEIDLAIYEIYGPLVPGQRRGDLLVKIDGGEVTKLNELILLDLNFDTNWWTTRVFEEGIDRDLRLAAQLLGKKDPRNQQLALYARLARPAKKDPAEIQRELTAAKLIVGPGASLPADSKLARAFCELVVATKVATRAELWASHQVALRARLEAQDHDALHLLCWLAAANHNPELAALDRLGWEEWNDPAFAPSYMVDLYREKKLTSPDDSQLIAAMAVAKDDATLNQLRLALAGEKDVTTDTLAGAIKAEFHKLSVGDNKRDSSMLNGLFYELGKRL